MVFRFSKEGKALFSYLTDTRSIFVIVFLQRIILSRIRLVNWSFHLAGEITRNRSGTRVDSVFPVVPWPLEGFCSRIFNLYHFPVQNVIWPSTWKKKFHLVSHYTYSLIAVGLTGIQPAQFFTLNLYYQLLPFFSYIPAITSHYDMEYLMRDDKTFAIVT